MQKKIKVLFLSVGYTPEVTPSDKKFVYDLINNLSNKVNVIVWSLNDKPTNKGKIISTRNNSSYIYYNNNRLFHKHLGNIYKPHPNHSNIRNGIEINISLIWFLYTKIKSIINTHKPDIIHLTDSFGPVAGIIKNLFKDLPVTINKPTVRLNSNFLYNKWVKIGLSNSDAIFTYTNAAMKKIAKLGIKKKKIKLLSWGINPKYKKPTNKEKILIRKRYNCNRLEPLIVILPRSNGENLIEYIKFIKEISISTNAKFIFAIRPTRYLKKFSKLETKKVIIESGPKDFFNLLSAADFAIGENFEEDQAETTSLLPLAWMDAMLRETPILTNKVSGIEELVKDKFSGMIFKDNNDFKKLLNIINTINVKYLKNNSKKTIQKKFNVNKISDKYYKFWKAIMNKNIN